MRPTNKWYFSVIAILTSLVLSSCSGKPVGLHFNPNIEETAPNQYRANIKFGFITFEDDRVALQMGDKTLIGWGTNTYHTNENIPDQVTHAFVKTYQYLGLNTVWIRTPPENFSFSTISWVRHLHAQYPDVEVFVIGRIQNYEFLLRTGGLSGFASGEGYSTLAITAQVRLNLFYLDSKTGKIIWGTSIHHNTFDKKKTEKAPVEYAANRLQDALHDVVMQSVDRILPKINKRNPGSVQVLAGGLLAEVPKTPEGKAPGKIPVGKGRLEIASKPSGARVYIDGIYYGVTPLSLDLTPGAHLLKVHKDGFETSRDKVGILEGRSTPWSGVLPKKN